MENNEFIYKGNLTFYSRPGFSSLKNCCLIDQKGLVLGPEESIFYDLNWIIDIKEGDILTVFKNSIEVIWQGKIIVDPEKTNYYGSVIDLVPFDIPFKAWLEWFDKEYGAELIAHDKRESNK